jgi:hypothetical protein
MAYVLALFLFIAPIAASETQANTLSEAFDAGPLYDAIKAQLYAIRSQHLSDAYHLYASKNFQKNTNYQQFESFIQSNPILKNYLTVDLNHLSFDNNMAEVKGHLVGPENRVFAIEYNLEYEPPQWKISYVHLVAGTVSQDAARSTYNGPITYRLEGTGL